MIVFSLSTTPANSDLVTDKENENKVKLEASKEQERKNEKKHNEAMQDIDNKTGKDNYIPPSAEDQAAYAAARAKRKAAIATCVREFETWGEDPVMAQSICTAQHPAPEPPRGVTVPDDAPDPAAVAQEAVLELELPAATPQIGPPPSINRWKVAIVGYPLWLWTEGSATMTQTVTMQGITLQMTARRTSSTFDMGDGETVTCTAMTKWTQASTRPAEKSPNCGYAYSTASKGNYTITATNHWEVTWSALGQTGVIELNPSDSVAIPVRELESVNTGG